MTVRDLSKQEAIQAVAAYIVATCERRLELQGYKWDEIRALTLGETPPSTARPNGPLQPSERGWERFLPGGNPVEGWAIARNSEGSLAEILSLSCMPLRFEPSNASLFHRGIASAGATYPIDVRLDISGLVGDSFWLQLDPYQSCLLQTGQSVGTDAASGEVRIVLSGDLRKCLHPYGDMSANLAAFEAGMIAHQILSFAQAFGWHAEAYLVGDAHKARRELGIGTPDLWPLLQLHISTGADEPGKGLNRGMFQPSGMPSSDLSGANFPFLERYRHACECRASRMENLKLAATRLGLGRYHSRDELRNLCLRRTSGALSGNGRPDEVWSNDEISGIIDHLSTSMAAGPCEQMARLSSVHLSFRVSETTIRSIQWEPSTGEFLERPTMPGEMAALEGMQASFIATFAIDDTEMLCEVGPRGHLASTILVGLLVQMVSLAATSLGRDARAIGAYDGTAANCLFSFDRRALLQVKASRSVRPNPSFVIG
ncbi:nitroreductase family protein [Parerythrobacter aestuarii]|uniref:hypothetical protein n=1 Tax=Parerythrobacter aestuarii TaxID=3020909 RepID=UPI0024DE7BEF|nr:hypothetical protein [Parerythrobacter aestuarii]